MSRLGRRVILGLWLAAVLLTSGISVADESVPRPLLALFETTRISLPQGPLPDGLRFVLYDDGQVITRSGPTQAEPDPAGRGVAYGVLDRAEVEGLRQEVAADLKEVAAASSGDPRVSEAGVTILEIWDGGRYRRFSAHARPCQAEWRTFTEGVWRDNRERTDRAFLKACDRLLQYKIAHPQVWMPKAVDLRIGAPEGKSDSKVDWPKSWPAAPADLKPKSASTFCAPVSADPGDFSSRLMTARWGDIGRTELVIDAGGSAVIWDWYFDLPAAIPMLNEKGEPDGTVGNACS